ncbi:hypothetical protein GCM10010276_28010 [Streptomyces longisporus]|uniref:Uncharacterized protein n=1 Tax=Streptomyces longisporus TaxID=1948 RepID=A0ABN3LRT6_STRLO
MQITQIALAPVTGVVGEDLLDVGDLGGCDVYGHGADHRRGGCGWGSCASCCCHADRGLAGARGWPEEEAVLGEFTDNAAEPALTPFPLAT